MIINIIIFIVGLALLCYGADWLVKGSSRMAESFGIKPLVVGLTVVAIGTSSPELVVSVVSIAQKKNDIALGNIIGSNICNIGLILGISALMHYLTVQKIFLKKELPIMIFSSALLFIFSSNLLISRVEGAVLVAGFIAFMLYIILSTLKSNGKAELDLNIEALGLRNNNNKLKDTIFIIIGIAGLVLGSHLMVKSSVVIAKSIGISDFVIGLVLVAFGTSLPELATSVAAAFRKETDILVGNVIGSNISNAFLVIGTVALLKPVTVDQSVLFFEFPAMMIFSFLLFVFLRAGASLQRIYGAIFLIGYVFVMVVSFYR